MNRPIPMCGREKAKTSIIPYSNNALITCNNPKIRPDIKTKTNSLLITLLNISNKIYQMIMFKAFVIFYTVIFA